MDAARALRLRTAGNLTELLFHVGDEWNVDAMRLLDDGESALNDLDGVSRPLRRLAHNRIGDRVEGKLARISQRGAEL